MSIVARRTRAARHAPARNGQPPYSEHHERERAGEHLVRLARSRTRRRRTRATARSSVGHITHMPTTAETNTRRNSSSVSPRDCATSRAGRGTVAEQRDALEQRLERRDRRVPRHAHERRRVARLGVEHAGQRHAARPRARARTTRTTCRRRAGSLGEHRPRPRPRPCARRSQRRARPRPVRASGGTSSSEMPGVLGGHPHAPAALAAEVVLAVANRPAEHGQSAQVARGRLGGRHRPRLQRTREREPLHQRDRAEHHDRTGRRPARTNRAPARRAARSRRRTRRAPARSRARTRA